MNQPIEIDKSLNEPVYLQIIEKIAAAIGQGGLKPGDKLPTERDLASHLEVARGTVTRAYAELARQGVIEVVQGRGSIVSPRSAEGMTGRKEKAHAEISSLIDSLTDLRFGFQEMRMMVDLAISEREESLASLNVAAVDCNPETLGMFERQIGLLSRVGVRKFLLEEITSDPHPDRRLGDFDLVITTSTHFPDLRSLAPSVADRILQVAVSPSQETVMKLAGVRPSQSMGALCDSIKFFSIIQNRLKEMHLNGPLTALYSPRPPGALAGFLRDKDVLILPPAGQAALSLEEARAVTAFTERGGLTLVFDYQIQKGSLVYVEERIRALSSRGGRERAPHGSGPQGSGAPKAQAPNG
jgi:DNA-binding transcriptional regulator YhcF (GntR family)